MTPQQIQQVRDRLAKITTTPWQVRESPTGFGDAPSYRVAYMQPYHQHGQDFIEHTVAGLMNQQDALFIADAPTDVAALLEELDHATDAIHDLQQESTSYYLGHQVGVQHARDVALTQLRHHQELEQYHSRQQGLSNNSLWLRHRHNAESLASFIRRLDTPPDPLPPQQLRSEIERLRAALRQCREMDRHGKALGGVTTLVNQVLGEDTPDPMPHSSS